MIDKEELKKSQTLLSSIQWLDRRQRAQMETQEAPFKLRMDLHSVREIKTLEQVAQRSSGVSILGDAQNPSLSPSWATCSSCPFSEQEVGLDELQKFLQPQPFCDST